MASPYDGGPAFPFPGWVHPAHSDGNIYPEMGMSTRDYFAAAALTGLVQNGDGPYFGTTKEPYNPWPWFATEAYRAADAMLAARNAPETKE